MTTTQFQQLIDAIRSLGGNPSLTDWIGASAAVLTLFVALWALNYARVQVDEAKNARKQARELELEKSQPYVVMYMEPSAAGQHFLDLVVRNYGQTAAHDVKIAISPDLRRSVHRNEEGEQERVLLPNVLPILAPGQEWRTFWDSGLDRLSSGLPDRHTGQVQYQGINSSEHTSPVVLDWSIYKQRRWLEIYGMHDAAKSLRAIRDNQKKWTEGPRGGFKVYARDGDAKDVKDREWLEENARRFREGRAAEQTEASEED